MDRPIDRPGLWSRKNLLFGSIALVRDDSVQGNVVAAFHPTLFSPARGQMPRLAGNRVARSGDAPGSRC